MAASPTCAVRETYGTLFEALRRAWESGAAGAFEQQLDELLRARERGVFAELGRVSRELDSALERFAVDSRIVDLAEKDVPDARQRLAHVLTMTDEAAHRTLDLVESACPLAERTGAAAARIAPLWAEFRARHDESPQDGLLFDALDRFLVEAPADAGKVRANLGEVLLAQGYQDLTGQIIRSVMHLVEEVEHTLAELVRLSHDDARASHAPARTAEDDAAFAAGSRRGFGPPVPGVTHGAVVSGQQDVDSLLSGLGL